MDFLYHKEINHSLSNYLQGKRVILVGPSKYLEGSQLGSWIDSFDVVVRQKNGFPVPKNQIQDLGQRTDLYYTNLKPAQHQFTREVFQEMTKLKMIIIPYPISAPSSYQSPGLFDTLRKAIKQVSNQIYQTIPDFKVPIKADYNANYFILLEKTLDTRPTTGLLTIMDLLQYPIKELHLTGFTFRHTLIDLQDRYLKGLPIDPKEIEKEMRETYSNSYKSFEQLNYSWEKTIKNGCHDLKKEFGFFSNLVKADPRIHLDSKMTEIFI